MLVGGLLGAIILAVDIYAIYRVLTGSGSPLAKILWIVLILLFPVIGVVLWFLLGQ